MAKQGLLKKVWNWVKIDSLKTALQILFGAGALFAGFKFIVYDRAAYNPRSNVTSTLEWRPSSLPGRCEAVFKVELQNSGVGTFDISKTQVRVWAFDSKVVNDQKAAYLSLDEMQKGEVLFDSDDPAFQPTFEATETTPFVGHYALGEKFHRSFQWVIKPDANNPNVYFRTDFTLNGDTKPRWFTAAWGTTCAGVQITQPSPSPSPAK